LVGSRIWTETAHIEQRLADLTGHMENVIQKYLRNQFQSIREYNAHAGEVAEPFRVVVVADFPVNFSLEAARRLVSIATSGPRGYTGCGAGTTRAGSGGVPGGPTGSPPAPASPGTARASCGRTRTSSRTRCAWTARPPRTFATG